MATDWTVNGIRFEQEVSDLIDTTSSENLDKILIDGQLNIKYSRHDIFSPNTNPYSSLESAVSRIAKQKGATLVFVEDIKQFDFGIYVYTSLTVQFYGPNVSKAN